MLQTANVLVTLKAPVQQDVQARGGMNLSLVVDVSGSMRSSMELLRQTLTFIINQMTSADHLSVIAFESSVKVRIIFSHAIFHCKTCFIAKF